MNDINDGIINLPRLYAYKRLDNLRITLSNPAASTELFDIPIHNTCSS